MVQPRRPHAAPQLVEIIFQANDQNTSLHEDVFAAQRPPECDGKALHNARRCLSYGALSDQAGDKAAAKGVAQQPLARRDPPVVLAGIVSVRLWPAFADRRDVITARSPCRVMRGQYVDRLRHRGSAQSPTGGVTM